MIFTDVHSHIIWDVDDGIQTVEDTTRCLEMAKRDNIGCIIATPHVKPGETDAEDLAEIRDKFSQLNQRASEYGIETYLGCELLLNNYSVEWVSQGLFNCINDTNYLLCEFNPRYDISEIRYAEEALYELTLKGVTPIVAHAERAFHGKIDIDRVWDWIDTGCYVQVNRESIVGLRSRVTRNNAMRLIELGLCHLIGTDTHEASGDRVMTLSDSYEIVSRKCGSDVADTIYFENPKRLLAGNELMSTEPIKRHRFFRK